MLHVQGAQIAEKKISNDHMAAKKKIIEEFNINMLFSI